LLYTFIKVTSWNAKRTVIAESLVRFTGNITEILTASLLYLSLLIIVLCVVRWCDYLRKIFVLRRCEPRTCLVKKEVFLRSRRLVLILDHLKLAVVTPRV